MKIMGKTILKGLLVGVAAGALTAGFVSTANAGAVVYSTLQISNFIISGGGGQLDLSDFDPSINISNSSGANTTLNGAGLSASDSAAGDVDVSLVCQGNCGGFAENQFAQTPFPPIDQFTRADSQLIGAGITGVPGASQDSVTATTVAEIQLNQLSNATGGADTGTVTRFSFSGIDDALTFDFDADAFLFAELEADGLNAQSSVSWSLSILQDGVGPIFTFAPNAVGAGSPCSLNMTIGTLSDNGPQTYACSGSFSTTTPVLDADLNYTLVINHVNEVRGAVGELQVPEPEAAALLGLGLLGLAAVRRRSRKA
jgi:hypothetical protein